MKRPGHEADEVKKDWSYTSILRYAFMAFTETTLPLLFIIIIVVIITPTTFPTTIVQDYTLLVTQLATHPNQFICHS